MRDDFAQDERGEYDPLGRGAHLLRGFEGTVWITGKFD